MGNDWASSSIYQMGDCFGKNTKGYLMGIQEHDTSTAWIPGAELADEELVC